MKFLLMFFCALSISSCSSAPFDKHKSKSIPSDRIYASNLINPTNIEHMASVLFFRDDSYYGSACTFDLYVNNIKAFSIKPSEVVELKLEPGEYIFKLQHDFSALCGNQLVTQEAVLKENSHREYIMTTPLGGSAVLNRTE